MLFTIMTYMTVSNLVMKDTKCVKICVIKIPILPTLQACNIFELSSHYLPII